MSATAAYKPIELHSHGTPNGQKVSILLEELGIAYDAIPLNPFAPGSGIDKFNPNGKIPVIVDPNFHAADGSEFTVIESGAILVHLAENYGNGRFLPKDPVGRSLAIQWCFWQMSGLGPIMGQYFHFAKFASEKIPYAVTRYTNETVRLLHVLETRLSTTGAYLGGAEYSIADIATYPWVRVFLSFTQQDEIVKAESFPNILRWHEKIAKRPAVVKGLTVLPM